MINDKRYNLRTPKEGMVVAPGDPPKNKVLGFVMLYFWELLLLLIGCLVILLIVESYPTKTEYTCLDRFTNVSVPCPFPYNGVLPGEYVDNITGMNWSGLRLRVS